MARLQSKSAVKGSTKMDQGQNLIPNVKFQQEVQVIFLAESKVQVKVNDFEIMRTKSKPCYS